MYEAIHGAYPILAFLASKVLGIIVAAVVIIGPPLALVLLVGMAKPSKLVQALLMIPASVCLLWWMAFVFVSDEVLPSDLRERFIATWSEFKDEPEDAPTKTVVGVDVRKFVLVSFDPPKPFYVTLRPTDGGETKKYYVARTCPRYRDNHVGDVYNLEVTRYTLSDTPDVVRYEFRNLPGVFC